MDSAVEDRTVEELRQVADAAEATAREQRRAARMARHIADERESGLSWGDITGKGSARSLTELLSSGSGRLRQATTRFRRLLASGLAAEGFTRREIGEHFGVSHQRVSALLSRREVE